MTEEQLPQPTADEPITLTVESRAHGWRLDHYLARLYPNFSRELFKRAIKQEKILVNGLPVRASRQLRVNDLLHVQLPEQPDATIVPEDIPLNILYEDEAIAVINKPPDMIVHPGKANYGGTLAAALQFHFNQLSDVAGQYRAGIVHRLDRDTSGVLVVAKNNQVHNKLSSQFEDRSVKKEYHALTWGEINFDSDYIETHLRPSKRHRERMVVCEPDDKSRLAVTFYEVAERFQGFTYVRLFPHTGRTHQLRVHMQHLRHQILADNLYGGHKEIRILDLKVPTDQLRPELAEENPVLIARQALHARRLEFEHPVSGQRLAFEAPLPEDFQRTLDCLRKYRAK